MSLAVVQIVVSVLNRHRLLLLNFIVYRVDIVVVIVYKLWPARSLRLLLIYVFDHDFSVSN